MVDHILPVLEDWHEDSIHVQTALMLVVNIPRESWVSWPNRKISILLWIVSLSTHMCCRVHAKDSASLWFFILLEFVKSWDTPFQSILAQTTSRNKAWKLSWTDGYDTLRLDRAYCTIIFTPYHIALKRICTGNDTQIIVRSFNHEPGIKHDDLICIHMTRLDMITINTTEHKPQFPCHSTQVQLYWSRFRGSQRHHEKD